MAPYSRNAFFDEIVRSLKQSLPGDLSQFQTRRFGHLIKIYYANERVHYEVWADSGRQHIEVGLHFEDGPESTATYLQYFDQRIVEIKAQTGPDLELERWTSSWGHIFETYPLEPFDKSRAQMIGRRLVDLVSVLQPIVEEADVAQTSGQRRTRAHFWSRRRR